MEISAAMTSSKESSRSYFPLYLSISISFVFSFIMGVYMFYDGIYFVSDNPLFILRIVLLMTFSSLFLVSILISIIAYIRYRTEKALFFLLYILLMTALPIGSIFLSRVSVRLDTSTMTTSANVAPYHLIYVPCLILIKLFLHHFVFSDIIRARKEEGLPIHLNEILVDRKKLDTASSMAYGRYCIYPIFLLCETWVICLLLCLYGFNFNENVVAPTFSVAMIIDLIVTSLYFLFRKKEKSLLACRLPILIVTIMEIILIVACILANLFMGSDTISPLTLQLEIVLPLSIAMFCFLVSTWVPVFKAMTERKKTKSPQKN